MMIPMKKSTETIFLENCIIYNFYPNPTYFYDKSYDLREKW